MASIDHQPNWSVLDLNTEYCFLKLFLMVGKELINP